MFSKAILHKACIQEFAFLETASTIPRGIHCYYNCWQSYFLFLSAKITCSSWIWRKNIFLRVYD